MANIHYVADASAIQSLKNGPGTIRGWHIGNGTAAALFVQFFDAEKAGDVTLGTTAPDFVVRQDTLTSDTELLPGELGIHFSNGIQFAVTTENDNATAPTVSTGSVTTDLLILWE